MVVTKETFTEVMLQLHRAQYLSVDTETTGLRAYHHDHLFSIIVAVNGADDGIIPYYFNFKSQVGVSDETVLGAQHLLTLKALFSEREKVWYAHNAKFDMAMLAREDIEILGQVHCTQAIERVVYNEHLPGSYDLASCAKRIGYEKDGTVEKYIDEHKLFDYTGPDKPGAREKLKHFDRVPFEIIVPYAERDAEITLRLGQHQEKALQKVDEEAKKIVPPVFNILRNERRLTHTIFRMERVGVKIDRDYCLRATQDAVEKTEKARSSFKKITGQDFLGSAKLFSTVFASEKDKWTFTEKNNPCFDSEALSHFDNPAAKAILQYRDSKSRADYYRGFLYHADHEGVVHATFSPHGAATGRFSSSRPNFQNLTAEEGNEAEEFIVRRAIVPRPGFIFIMPDYDQMEYRMMFDQACILYGEETPLVRKIKYQELDPHQATADLVTEMGHMTLTRKRAKNGNFAELYGSGTATLAKTISSTLGEAQALKDAIREAAPEIRNLTQTVLQMARLRGYIYNWTGRRCHLRDSNLAYKMTNYLIQGGCADVNKFALNQIDEYLKDKKSRLVMTVHDENIVEVHESELHEVPKRVKEIMENIYPYKYLPLTCGMEWSDKSLGDKQKGFPV